MPNSTITKAILDLYLMSRSRDPEGYTHRIDEDIKPGKEGKEECREDICTGKPSAPRD